MSFRFYYLIDPNVLGSRKVFRNNSVTTPAGEPEAVYGRDARGALASRELAFTEDLEKTCTYSIDASRES